MFDEVKQLLWIYTGYTALVLVALIAGGVREAEFTALLFIFGFLTEAIVNIVKSHWF